MAWRHFLRGIRNLSGDMKMPPRNNNGNGFNFCHHESIDRWESSYNQTKDEFETLLNKSELNLEYT